MEEPVIGSATTADRFIFVSWPKSEWPLNIRDEPVLAPLARWAQHYDAQNGGKTTIRWVQLPQTSYSSDHKHRSRTDLWLLPQGYKLENVALSTIADSLNAIFISKPSTSSSSVATSTSLGRVIVVCTHGRYDQCCAKYGQQVWKQLSESHIEATVLPGSHLGGHRFAATLLDFIPEHPGRMYGRVKADEISTLVDHLASKSVWLDRYRGRVDLSGRAQVVEAEALRHGALAHERVEITAQTESQYIATWANGSINVHVASKTYQGPKSCTIAPESWNRWYSRNPLG